MSECYKIVFGSWDDFDMAIGGRLLKIEVQHDPEEVKVKVFEMGPSPFVDEPDYEDEVGYIKVTRCKRCGVLMTGGE